ncbi:MAG: ABC transporter permease subunit [Planctomycetales bacterium]|nr:ABC transporter permease subunit [Planctomycetales bacterium]
MGIDVANYHGWSGRQVSPWRACAAMVRVALLQVFRRKSYWIVLALGLINFFVAWSVIYAVTQFQLPRDAQRELLKAFGFDLNPASGAENGYIMFMQRQSLIVTILLAFSGSLLVGGDFRQGALPFYLSRRIDRRHYIVGKLLAIAAVISLLTVLPALVLYVEYGMFTSSVEYWTSQWRTVASILSFGAVQCVVLGIMLVTLSAYLQRTAPIAITWTSAFIMLRTMSGQLREATENDYWDLIDPWRTMRFVGRLCFGGDLEGSERELAWWSLAVLATACTAALILLVRRVRAVDVVE